MRSSTPQKEIKKMVSRDWIRRAQIRLDEIETARALPKPEREVEAKAPRVSVVIDERVRLEFSPPPRSLSVGSRQAVAGRTPQRGALILEVEVW
jgi:hypothetical protein